MRDYVKSILALAALVLCSANGLAEDTTVDRFAITITLDGGDPGTKSPGEVKGEISADGNTATLTVKANDGYYINKSDIVVTKSVSGSSAHSRRLASTDDQGPALNPQIQLSSTQVNPKGTTEYTFAVTSAEYIYEVTADFHSLVDLTLSAANALTIESGKATVTVDGTTASPDKGKIVGLMAGQTVNIIAKEGYKFIKAVDGRTVYTSEVDMDELEEGDILAEGFSLTGNSGNNIFFNANRYKVNNIPQSNTSDSFGLSFISSYGSNIAIDKDNYTPVDEKSRDGNAWVVTDATTSPAPGGFEFWTDINLSGTTYTPLASLNAAKTEATMTMPASDVTLSYDLRRDLAVKTAVSVVDAQSNSRFCVQKQGTADYQPVDMTTDDFLALITVSDQKENSSLTVGQDCNPLIFPVDDQGEPQGNGILLANFDYAPGNYIVKAIAIDGSIYDGQTDKSNTFQLFEGYEVEVPANEYITYYSDEPLRIVDPNAELYTVSSVSGQTATLSGPYDALPANTPMLVHNTGTQAATILLIPCAAPDLYLTVYSGFTGTLTDTKIAASSATTDNYAFNGKQFVWVKNSLSVAANKAWLAVPKSTNNARALTLVFGDATGLSEELRVKSEEFATATWYTLEGRKLDKQPTKKGVYILRSAEGRLQGKNGRKVVIK